MCLSACVARAHRFMLLVGGLVLVAVIPHYWGGQVRVEFMIIGFGGKVVVKV